MIRDEKGYVQFRCDWDRAGPPEQSEVFSLAAYRNQLWSMGLIGVYPDGIGFGNVSVRTESGRFLVTGTATGHMPTIGPAQVTEVIEADASANFVRCRGPVAASSESLSHAAVYSADPAVGAVVHVHHLIGWQSLRGILPTTDVSAEAGTPEMARAIVQLLRAGVPGGVFVMGGHREGLMSFGPDLAVAFERISAVVCDVEP